MSDVFISYSRKDKAFVQILHNALEASNRETWVDWENIPKGTEWWQQIEAGIEGANTFIFVISPDSVASSVCGDEINHAIKNGKRFLPIVRRDVEFSQFEDINPSHQELRAHNWLFFREEDIFEQSFADLVISLQTDVEYVQQHTEILREAKKWENNQRNDSFLLQGDALTEAERWLEDAEKRLKASESAQETEGKKNPNPLLTEQQRNFIQKSRESEDARARTGRRLRMATIISVVLLAVSLIGGLTAYTLAQQKIAEANKAKQDLVDLDTQKKAIEAKAKQVEQNLVLVGKNLTLATDKLTVVQQQQLDAQQAAEKARQDKSIAQANLIKANKDLRSAKDQKLEAEKGLVTARLETQKVERQKAETELQRQAAAVEVKAIQSEALVNQDRPFDALLLALRTGDKMRSLETKSFDAKTKRSAEWETKFALLDALSQVREQNRLANHNDLVSSVAITPDGKTLVSGSYDETIKVWNLRTGEQPKTLIGHKNHVTCVAITPDAGESHTFLNIQEVGILRQLSTVSR